MMLDAEQGQAETSESVSNDPTPPVSSTETAVDSAAAQGGAAALVEHAESPTSTEAAPTEVAEAAPSTEVAEAMPSAEASAERPRVQLNPTFDPNQARAIPSIGGEVGVAQVIPSGPAEIPRDVDLPQDLAAEIDAAMGGASANAAVPPAAPVPSVELPANEEELAPGTQLKAKVQSITEENVFVDVGYRSPGMVSLKQFPQGKHPNVGEEFLVHVDKFDSENRVLLVNLPRSARKVRGNWEDLHKGQVVDAVVLRSNKGGLEVSISNLRGFLPASQIELGFVASMDSYVGQKFPVEITEVNPTKRNLVVSRKSILIVERKDLSEKFWGQAEVGQKYGGRVKTIKEYGAFIDIGGVDGFLHIGEMSWTRIKHPSDVLQEGQSVDVIVLSLDRDKHKIGLGMRQLSQNPWATIGDRLQAGSIAGGKVSRVTDFGAFVELEPGIEGLIHISELEYRRIKKVTDVVDVGHEIQAKVLEVDPARQRISLSLKAMKENPEEVAAREREKAEDAKPGYERKRREPLRGGMGNPGGGGLFGNPSDFGGKKE